MNKLRIYIIVSLWFIGIRCFACWFPPSVPRDNLVYRLMEDVSPYYNYTDDMYSRYKTSTDIEERAANLKLWRKQTGCTLTDTQLEAIVYEWGIKEVKKEQRLVNKQLGTDGFNLLLIAKLCESVRNNLNDPWYYPSKDDAEVKAMLNNIGRAMKYRGKLLNRYALQVVRMLMAVNRYNETIEYWEKVKPLLGNDVVTNMAERRVAAAYLKKGDVDIAKKIYVKFGDLASLRQCNVKEGEEWELIYKMCPDSPFFIRELQNVLVHYDNRLYQNVVLSYYLNHLDWNEEDIASDKREVARIKNLARRVIKEKRAKNLDIWYYTLAALLDAECEYKEALKVINEGQKHCTKGSFLANSMRVLRICVEAESSKYDSEYKARLVNDLRWLDENGRKEYPQQMRKMLEAKDDSYIYDFRNSYYWSDMINRICADILASRLKNEGYVSDAIMFANMGEYWLVRRCNDRFLTFADSRNCFCSDYTSAMAEMADTCNIVDVEKAYLRLSQPNDGLDRLISSMANTEKNFWSDYIGTFCIREHKYDKAVMWLSKCERNWQKKLNTWEYLDRNPFSPLFGLEPNKKYILKSKFDYKLNYAREMSSLEKKMHSSNADERGEAMLRYGIGLRNQSDWAWALTRYRDSWDFHDDNINGEFKKSISLSKKYIDKGLATLHNKELKAQYLHAFVRNKEVMLLCSETKMAKYLRSHCDLWKNYK